MPGDTGLLAPFEYRHARQFRAIVGNACHRLASLPDRGIELTGDPQASQRRVRHKCQTFPAEVIDRGQNPEPASGGEGDGYEVQALRFACPVRQQHRPFDSEGTLSAATLANLRLLFAVTPHHLLMVHGNALPLRPPMDMPATETP